MPAKYQEMHDFDWWCGNHPDWDDARRNMYIAAWEGLENGDLEPLFKYLDEDYIIGSQLALYIKWAIRDDDFPYKLKLVGKKRGQKTASEMRAHQSEVYQIGAMVWRRVMEDTLLKVENVCVDVAKEMGVGRSKVFESYQVVKKDMEQKCFDSEWGLLREFLPEWFDVAPNGTVSRRSQKLTTRR